MHLSGRRKISITLTATALIVLVAAALFIALRPSYTGKDAVLLKPDSTTLLHMDNAVLSSLPKAKSEAQANISVAKYTGAYVQGVVSYADSTPAQRFMAAKSHNTWKVIAHNTGRRLTLPDIDLAKQYQLPKGWYTP